MYFLLSNPALTPLQKRPFPLAKMPKIRDFNVDLNKKFRPSPDPTPLGAPALRASTPRSEPSVPPSSVPERFSEILAPANSGTSNRLQSADLL